MIDKKKPIGAARTKTPFFLIFSPELAKKSG